MRMRLFTFGRMEVVEQNYSEIGALQRSRRYNSDNTKRRTGNFDSAVSWLSRDYRPYEGVGRMGRGSSYAEFGLG